MCDYCSHIEEIEIFSPKDYHQIMAYIKEMVEKEHFIFTEGSCALDEYKKNGMWFADIIYHVIKCPECGQEFTCHVNTYRGGGRFKRGGYVLL